MTLARLAVLMMIIFVVSFSGFTGYAQDAKVLDSRDGLRLVSRNNDLYIENDDGSNSKQVTNTPEIGEIDASFSKDGGYIKYVDQNYEAHIVKYDSNDEAADNLAIQEQLTYQD